MTHSDITQVLRAQPSAQLGTQMSAIVLVMTTVVLVFRLMQTSCVQQPHPSSSKQGRMLKCPQTVSGIFLLSPEHCIWGHLASGGGLLPPAGRQLPGRPYPEFYKYTD